ncbi:hypothetical protein Q3G72_013665 [Acer saccharum]|nr:hypothetical protein Q3G72_013665 [Acer saccharum]
MSAPQVVSQGVKAPPARSFHVTQPYHCSQSGHDSVSGYDSERAMKVKPRSFVGKVIVLMKIGCPVVLWGSVNVLIGSQVFPAVVEEAEHVSHSWLSSLLGLVECKSGLNLDGDCFDANLWEEASHVRDRDKLDRRAAKNYHEREKVSEKPTGRSFRSDKEEFKKDGLGDFVREGKKASYKVGKQVHFGFENRTSTFRNPGLKGECSKMSQLDFGPVILHRLFRPNSIPISNIYIDLRNSSNRSPFGPTSNSDSSGPISSGQGLQMLVVESGTQAESGFDEGNGVMQSVKDATIAIIPSVSTPAMPKSKRGGKKLGIPKCHSMKTRWFERIRQEKGNEVETPVCEKWNLEVEVAKMIKEGYARGFFSKKKGSGASNNKENGNVADGLNEVDQFLEVEMTKILETGLALGFDFHSQEKEVSDRIASREAEDDQRLVETNN